jgi:hypothetical protein
VFSGELAIASSLVEEVAAVKEATGSGEVPHGAVALVAFQRSAAEAFELIEAATREIVRRGEGEGLAFIRWAIAVLHNGLEEQMGARQLHANAGAAERLDGLTVERLGGFTIDQQRP